MNIDATAESNILDMTDDNDIEECEKNISNKSCDNVDPKKPISSSGKTEETVDKEEAIHQTINQVVQKYLDEKKQLKPKRTQTAKRRQREREDLHMMIAIYNISSTNAINYRKANT